MNSKFKGNKLVNSKNMTQEQQNLQKQDIHFAKSRYALEYVERVVGANKAPATDFDTIIKEADKIRKFLTYEAPIVKTL